MYLYICVKYIIEHTVHIIKVIYVIYKFHLSYMYKQGNITHIYIHTYILIQFSSVQSFSCVQLFETSWTAVRQASLSISNYWSLLKLMSIKSVMPSNHHILCRPLLLPSTFPRIIVFSNESTLRIKWPKYWSFSFNITSSNEY